LHDHEELIEEADAAHRDASLAQRRLFALILEIDLTGAWRDSGARDLAHWVGMRYGISYWKASRWIAAAHALEELPLMSEAFSSGDLGADKVVELTRFATPETESRLITWAQGVSVGAIRHKGDLARASIQEAQEADRARRVEWWYFSENSRFGLSAELPAAQGAVVAKALERLADILPVMPGEEGDFGVEARRADALVALCSARIAADPDPDRGTAVIHARVDGSGAGVMEGQLSDCEIEGGPAIHPEVARRLLCTARGPDGAGGLLRPPGPAGTDQEGASGVDGAPAQVPGPGVPVPGVRLSPVHPGPPHQVVGPGWPDRPGQPGADLLVPPQAGARVRVEGQP
jgi:hypothetical protein